MTKKSKKEYAFICCICKSFIDGEFGNNANPVVPLQNGAGYTSRCCDKCNSEVVLPVRNVVAEIPDHPLLVCWTPMKISDEDIDWVNDTLPSTTIH